MTAHRSCADPNRHYGACGSKNSGGCLDSTPATAAGPKRQKVACQGIGGRLFGHKFKKNVGDKVYNLDYCSRCGMPVGGWR